MSSTLHWGPERGRRGRNRWRTRNKWGKLVPVSELESGRQAVVKRVQGSRKVRQRLADLGVTTETSIRVVKAAPFNGPVELAVRGSILAIGREIANNILVQEKGT